MTVTSDVGHWAMVPSWVRKALRGHDRAMSLYVLLADVADHPNREQGETSALAQGKKRKWLAEELACSPASVDRSLDVLIEVGAVTVTHRKAADGDNLPNDYHVHQLPPAVLANLTAAREAAAAVEPVGQAGSVEGGMRVGEQRGCPPGTEGEPDGARGPRVGAEVIRNQPPSNQPPFNQQPQPDVASDAGPAPEEDDPKPSPPQKQPKPETLHPNYAAAFDVVARAFGLDPIGLSTATRTAINRARKGAFRAGLLDDLDHLADVIWLYRGTRAQPAIGTFAAAAADVALSPAARLIRHRSEAAEIVAEVCAELELGPAGRAISQPTAEVAAALLLDANEPADAIAAALTASHGWSEGQLKTAMGQADQAARRAHLSVVDFPPAPDDLSRVMVMDMVEMFRRGLPAMDVMRVSAELHGRVNTLTAHQRDRLLAELNKGEFSSINQVPTVIGNLIRLLKPADPQRDERDAADLAAWGQGSSAIPPVALPRGGTTR